jgi:hypothetical protein
LKFYKYFVMSPLVFTLHSTHSMATIDSLPREILYMIANSLPVKSLLRLKQTSRGLGTLPSRKIETTCRSLKFTPRVAKLLPSDCDILKSWSIVIDHIELLYTNKIREDQSSFFVVGYVLDYKVSSSEPVYEL